MDPIADMLTTIRNAIRVGKYDITVPHAKAKWHILKVFEDLGLLSNIKRNDELQTLSFTILLDGVEPKFSELKRMSTPGRRIYVGWREIPRASRNGVVIVSTSQGVMTGRDAKNRHLGGELICEIS